MEDFLDDRVMIAEKIKQMSAQEIDAEIARLEQEAAQKKKEVSSIEPSTNHHRTA